jgi:hypothetical protein
VRVGNDVFETDNVAFFGAKVFNLQMGVAKSLNDRTIGPPDLSCPRKLKDIMFKLLELSPGERLFNVRFRNSHVSLRMRGYKEKISPNLTTRPISH